MRRLSNHPGVPVAFLFSVMGFVAGFQRGGFVVGLIGAAGTSVFWIIVLWTAWVDRDIK